MFLAPFACSQFPGLSPPNNMCVFVPVCLCACVHVCVPAALRPEPGQAQGVVREGESRPIHRHKDIINQIGKWFEKLSLEHCVLPWVAIATLHFWLYLWLCVSDVHIKSHKWLSFTSLKDHTHTLFLNKWILEVSNFLSSFTSLIQICHEAKSFHFFFFLPK